MNKKLKINGNLIVLVVALVVVVAVFSLLNRNYFTTINMVNILIAASLVGLVAIGHTYLIIEGQNDLSPGSLVAFLGVLSALLVSRGVGFAPTLLVTMVVGAIVGLCNAFMVNQLKLEALGNRRGQRSDLSGEERFDAAAVIAADSGGSKSTVHRYLRLNRLCQALLDLVDAGSIGVEAGGNLSYLSDEQQEQLLEVMAENHLQKISKKQSEEIRSSAEAEQLTEATLVEALGCVKKSKPVHLSVKVELSEQLSPREAKTCQAALKRCKNDPQFIQELLELLRRYGGTP